MRCLLLLSLALLATPALSNLSADSAKKLLENLRARKVSEADAAEAALSTIASLCPSLLTWCEHDFLGGYGANDRCSLIDAVLFALRRRDAPADVDPEIHAAALETVLSHAVKELIFEDPLARNVTHLAPRETFAERAEALIRSQLVHLTPDNAQELPAEKEYAVYREVLGALHALSRANKAQ